MNLMVLSPGRRCELISYFKDEFNKSGARVIAVDINKYAPALYSADKYHVIKKDFDNLGRYIEDIIRLCEEEEAEALLTLIDPELKLLSQYRKKFEENNIKLILSCELAIKDTFDKYSFYANYKNKLGLAKTYRYYKDAIEGINRGELKYPLIVKLVNGSASMGIQKVDSESQLKKYETESNYIFQEYIEGKEIGVDVYFDMVSKKIVSVFMKEKIAMRSGETDKSLSIFQKDILEEILKLEPEGYFCGPVDIDVFISSSGKIRINEINPRFGGGYPHAHYCGVDFVKLIANNVQGIENKVDIGNYRTGIEMMKYNNFLFRGNEAVNEK